MSGTHTFKETRSGKAYAARPGHPRASTSENEAWRRMRGRLMRGDGTNCAVWAELQKVTGAADPVT